MPLTPQESVVEEIRAMIASMPPDDAQSVNMIANQFRAIIERYGSNAIIAIALVGAEEAAKE